MNNIQLLAGGSLILILLFLMLIYLILRRNHGLTKVITELNSKVEKLEEKEYLFRTLFEQSPMGISFGNYQDNVLDANPMYEKIIGRPLEDLNAMSWREYTHPEDLDKDVDMAEKLKRQEIDGYTLVKRYIRPDQSIVWVNMTIAPLKLKNDLNHLCIVEDITERVRAEEALQESNRQNAMLLSNLPGMAYRCKNDSDWTMHFVSEGCLDLTGYHPDSLIHNKVLAFNDIIAPQFREAIREKWTKVLQKHEMFKDEYIIITASGENKWVLEQGRGVYKENGEIEAIEGLIIDITDRKKREEEISYLNYHDVLTGLYNRRFFDEIIMQYDNKLYYPLSVIIGDINGLKLINDALGHTEGDRILVIMANILKNICRAQDLIVRAGGDEFYILLPNTEYDEAEKLMKKIQQSCNEYTKETKNEIYNLSISLGCAAKVDQKVDFKVVIKDAEDNMYRDKLLQNKSFHSLILSSMKTTLFAKSQETQEHAQRLVELSRAIGQKMKLSEKELNALEILSALHDIGKIGISDVLLNKPDKLTDDEWIEMKKHPEIGYRIAMSIPELAPIAEYILCHHERFDGKGYPQGLQKDAIPLLSRILTIVDAYDAMTSDRSYRKALSKEQAIEEIKRCSGSQFDPEIVKILLEIL